MIRDALQTKAGLQYMGSMKRYFERSRAVIIDCIYASQVNNQRAKARSGATNYRALDCPHSAFATEHGAGNRQVRRCIANRSADPCHMYSTRVIDGSSGDPGFGNIAVKNRETPRANTVDLGKCEQTGEGREYAALPLA